MRVDWSSLLALDLPVLEIVVRGTVMYLGVFALLRMIVRRPTGNRSLGELLLVVLLADAAQNGMADGYSSITSGLLLVGTIMFWNWSLEVLSMRVGWMQRLVMPSPLLVVRDGEAVPQAMRKENLTMDELRTLLRLKGVNDISRVRAAHLEGLGGISLELRENEGDDVQHEPDSADPTLG